MNKQRPLIATLTAFLFSISLSIHAQTTVGVRAGLNFAGVRLVDENGKKQDTEAIPSFQVGLTVDIPLAADFYVQPAALYSGKGFKQDGGWLAAPGNEFKAKASYIEVPVNLLYKPHLGIGNLLIGAGPYVGYGIGGKWKAEGQIVVGDIVLSENYGDVIFKNDVMDGEFGNYLYGKPWDYGANILIGYEFLQKLTLQFNAQFGIANLEPEVSGTTRDGSVRNRGYGISVGYRF
jgi:hypothetical protein